MEISRCPSPATIASKLNAIIKSPVKGHSCDFRTCDIENLSVEIHKLNGKFVILCKYIKPPEGMCPCEQQVNEGIDKWCDSVLKFLQGKYQRSCKS